MFLKVNQSGITLIELMIVIAIVGILAAVGIPEINRFAAEYKARSAATDLIQNMRLARAMAIKENREYLLVFDRVNRRYMVGFDGDGDNNLITVNSDTFGVCADTNGDRIPDNDALLNDLPRCVRTVDLNNYGSNVIFGYNTGTTPANGPNGATIPISGVNFSGAPPTAEFDSNGSMDKLGSVYFQHTGRGYSYCVRISTNAGSVNVWRWDGDSNNPGVTTWRQVR